MPNSKSEVPVFHVEFTEIEYEVSASIMWKFILTSKAYCVFSQETDYFCLMLSSEHIISGRLKYLFPVCKITYGGKSTDLIVMLETVIVFICDW